MAEVEVDEWQGPREDVTKRVGRALGIATLLMNQPQRWTRAALAERFEVDKRTIDRDLAVLRNLGFAIIRHGDGYAFERVPVLPAVMFSLPEVMALVLAAELARASGDIDVGSLSAALGQLERLIPAEARPLIRHEVLAWTTTATTPARRRTALQTVLTSLAAGRQVRITYATGSRGGAVNDRVIEPYAVRPYDRSWMITAFDHLRQEIRDFKIDRVLSATLLRAAYSIPADFDLAAYRGATWGALRGEATAPVAIALLFDKQGGRWVQEEQPDEKMSFEELPDGRVRATLTVGITEEMVRWILGWGPHCVVELPQDLRKRVQAMAEETARQYD